MDCDAIDARIAALAPEERAGVIAELRVRGLASLAGFQLPDRLIEMAEAVEMLAVYEGCPAREARKRLLAELAAGKLLR